MRLTIVAFLLCSLTYWVGCKKDTPTGPVDTAPTQTQATKTVGASVDSVVLTGIKVCFDQGTFASSTVVTVARDNNVPVVLSSNDGLYDAQNVFRISIAGDTLRMPARVTLTYSPNIIPSGTSEADLIVVHFTSNGWEFLQGAVNTQNKTITCQASSFSYFSVGVSTHKVAFPTGYTPLNQAISFESETVPGSQIQSYDYSSSLNASLHHDTYYWGTLKPPSSIDPTGTHGKVAYAAAIMNNQLNPTYDCKKDVEACLVFRLDLRGATSAALEFDYNCKSYPYYDYFVVEISNDKLVRPLTNWPLSWVALNDQNGSNEFWGNGTWKHERFEFPQFFVLWGLGVIVGTCGDPTSDAVLVRVRFVVSTSRTTYPSNYGPFIDNVIFKTPAPPTVTTTGITGITSNAATGGGNVTSEGNSSVTARGVCWSPLQNPTTADSKTVDGSGAGSFTSSIAGLSSSTPYYLRAYATNSVGTSYGSQVSFVTTSLASGTWEVLPSNNLASGDANSVVVNNKVYFVTSMNSGLQAELRCFDPNTNEWGTISEVPNPRRSAALASIGNRIYVLGDELYGVERPTDIYDISSHSWSQGAPMGIRRAEVQACEYNGKIYVMGGRYDGPSATDALEIYDPQIDTWITKAIMPGARFEGTAQTCSGKVYYIGGAFGANSTVYEYDPNTNAWTVKNPMLYGRFGSGGCIIGKQVYVFGGYPVLRKGEIYFQDGNTWQALAEIPFDFLDGQVAYCNSAIYVFSGGNVARYMP
jgi:hypothetical protein